MYVYVLVTCITNLVYVGINNGHVFAGVGASEFTAVCGGSGRGGGTSTIMGVVGVVVVVGVAHQLVVDVVVGT